MAEWFSTRRAWIRLAIVALVLVVCGPLLWRLRPLSLPERQLVGTWACQPRADHCFQYRSDRRFASFPRYGPPGSGVLEGTWSCDATTLFYRNEMRAPGIWHVIPTFLRRLTTGSRTLPIEFLGEDRISIGGLVYVRIPYQEGPQLMPAEQIPPGS